MLKYRQNQFIEKLPLVCEKLGKEWRGHDTRAFRQYWAEKAENPVWGVHFALNLVLFKVGVDHGEVGFDQEFYDVGVFWKAGEAYLEDVSTFTLLNEINKQPKSERITTMNQQLPNQKVHTLHIVSLFIITRESPQHFPELPVPSIPRLKKLILRKSSAQISVNLKFAFLFWSFLL